MAKPEKSEHQAGTVLVSLNTYGPREWLIETYRPEGANEIPTDIPDLSSSVTPPGQTSTVPVAQTANPVEGVKAARGA